MVVRRWDPATQRVLTATLDRTRAGSPGVLVVDGEPGMGKSSLLDELVARAAPDFRVLRSEGLDTGVATPYGVLGRWGVDVSPTQSDDVLAPVVAAQRLRDLLARLAPEGPVLLVLDDLHWADPESLDATIDVISRASGDRLLLAVGSWPDPTTAALQRWQQWVSRPERAVHLRLNGLPLPDATLVMQELRPDLDAATAEVLWRHTGGNPLYLRALVAEYRPDELVQMDVLPAPAAYAQSVVAALAQLPEDAVLVARAAAVLGPGWVSALDVAELADTGEPAEALQRLAAAALLETRRIGAVDNVRATHALVRSAVYLDIPIPQRRALHARAAGVVTARAAVLDHRIAAADGYDDVLADELESYADEQHRRRAYRSAAHYWAASSALTRQASERERRRLEAYFDTVLGGDRNSVRADLDVIGAATDPVRSALVAGIVRIWDRQPAEGVEALSAALPHLDDTVDARTTYRVSVLLAWALLQSGRPTEQISAALDRASGTKVVDGALQGLALLATGTIRARSSGLRDVLATVADLPSVAASVPMSMTPALVWRGTACAMAGRFAAGEADLLEVTDRVHNGQVDINGGAMHAILGRAQWFLGRWPLARVNFRIAAELAHDQPHPLTVAAAPLVAIGAGDVASAEASLQTARDVLGRAPWLEAVDLLTITEVIHAHAQGTAAAGVYARMRDSVREVRAGRVAKNLVWLVHAGLAALWADELDDAADCAARVTEATSGATWTVALGEWLAGLVAERHGNGRLALNHLRAAVAADSAEVPLYRGHVLLDHARLAHLLGDLAAASQSLDAAARCYEQLGAVPYLERAELLRRSRRTRPSRPLIALSGRERDVLTLAVEGLSYAQIARDLFITQSTVSYHLGNIYAKADVSSRHQLTEVVRADPAVFGLA